MSFLSRVLLIIGLSFVMTLILMVILWEPERPSPVNVVETPPLDLLAKPEPRIRRATDVRTASSKPSRDGDGVEWTMQDAREIEGLPAEARTALAGCVVPRSPDFPNVVTGQFKQAGQTDVAVLCVRGPGAAVYVFSGAPGRGRYCDPARFQPGHRHPNGRCGRYQRRGEARAADRAGDAAADSTRRHPVGERLLRDDVLLAPRPVAVLREPGLKVVGHPGCPTNECALRDRNRLSELLTLGAGTRSCVADCLLRVRRCRSGVG